MKHNEPKVSIIIPVYNGSNFLAESIKSALNQTYKNTEIIVVNDGSNDHGKTENIAKSFGKLIKYFEKENGGVSTALNLGISKMSGEYFTWLSHDDLLYPDKIEKQINFYNNSINKKFVLYTDYALLKNNNIIPVKLNKYMLDKKPKYSLLRGSVNGITVMIPRDIIDEMGFFDESLKCTQDYNYWMRIQNKYEFTHLNEVLSVTRIHGKQDSVLSPNVIREGNELWMQMIEWVEDYEKIEYEKTLINYYSEMSKFLDTTPYNLAKKYCEDKILQLRKNNNSTKKFLVSVIIPFYNRIDDTVTAVYSALNQTYNNLEIILVNDNSSDDIKPILNLIKNNSNIKLITQKKNMGAAAARNRGIIAATGDYLAFLDSDDEFKVKKIEIQLNEMIERNPIISYTSYIKRTENNESEIGTYGISGFVIPRIISSCPIATPTVMISRKFLIENQILFNQNIRIGEDTCFWLDIAKKTEILGIENALSIVNVVESSSAYDLSKLQIGLQNILQYLSSDDYYRNFVSDISKLAADYAAIQVEIDRMSNKRLELFGKSTPSISSIIIDKWKITPIHRLARKIRRDGFSEAYKLTLSKVKSRIAGL